jgi:hypothetical protein
LSAALITASSGVLVAVIVYTLNTLTQLRAERKRIRVDRLATQLRDLYGPLNALVDVNERLWTALHDAGMPSAESRRSKGPTAQDPPLWEEWYTNALLPISKRMRDLLLENADLLIAFEFPEEVKSFCAHVAAAEVATASPSFELTRKKLWINHPGTPFVRYVRNSYHTLKKQHSALVG